MRLASAIDRVKHDKGLTQAEIAHMLGVKQASISYWKSGKKKPNLDKLDQLCELLGIKPIWLLFGEENKPTDNPLLKSISRLPMDQQQALSSLISNTLSESEQDLIDKYAKLNSNNQASLLRLVDNILETQNPELNPAYQKNII